MSRLLHADWTKNNNNDTINPSEDNTGSLSASSRILNNDTIDMNTGNDVITGVGRTFRFV
jgi:hypothetical protein